jgi:hypothetical protein
VEASSQVPGGAKQTRDEEGVEYVVQRRLVGSVSSVGGDGPAWLDIATVTVPKRSQTRTIVVAGTNEAGIKPALTDRFRVLDTTAARELQLKPKAQPEPEFEVTVVVDGESHEVPED